MEDTEWNLKLIEFRKTLLDIRTDCDSRMTTLGNEFRLSLIKQGIREERANAAVAGIIYEVIQRTRG